MVQTLLFCPVPPWALRLRVFLGFLSARESQVSQDFLSRPLVQTPRESLFGLVFLNDLNHPSLRQYQAYHSPLLLLGDRLNPCHLGLLCNLENRSAQFYPSVHLSRYALTGQTHPSSPRFRALPSPLLDQSLPSRRAVQSAPRYQGLLDDPCLPSDLGPRYLLWLLFAPCDLLDQVAQASPDRSNCSTLGMPDES